MNALSHRWSSNRPYLINFKTRCLDCGASWGDREETACPAIQLKVVGRNCLECVHCYFEQGYDDLSDVTPGEPMVLQCQRDLWPKDVREHDDTTKADLAEFLDLASVCRTFEPDPKVKQRHPDTENS